ncbi:acyltransferase family protein [Iodobacter ciconiae]|uniref:Acyltransferase n=1 Tax=Iodobacter ciconiae TaxID=2496266 RepID=A0A3S8ZUK1_9NEIS|nr:acyltransferase family protein [Iodobacter ciconiae]AZN37170.1 acyltransferase [Iodobacter ciconiae]
MNLINKAPLSGYIAEIDSLRAIAVLAVILFHFNPLILPGGFSGVDVFFVISGYVVSASLAKSSHAHFVSFVLQFYSRRIIRIYPALLACLIVIGLLQTLFVPASWLSQSSNNTALYAFAGLSNFALIWFNDGYFSPRVEFNAFTHTWSLAVEEQFYLLFPFVFFIWIKYKEQKNLMGKIAAYLLPLLFFISLLYCAYETQSAPDHAYYLLPSRFWELASGAMLFIFHQQNKLIARSKHSSNFAIALGIILIVAAFMYSDPKSFPFPWALLATSGTLCLITGVTGQSDKGFLRITLQFSWLVYIGKISYSLYLWHWPVLVLFRWTSGLDHPGNILAAVLATGLCSIFSYHFLERPIRKNIFIHSKQNWKIVSGGVSIILLCFISTQYIFKAQPWLSLSVTRDVQNWYPEPWPSAGGDLKTPAFTKRRIFILGDSHAAAYRTMLRKLSDEQGIEVLPYSAAGCPVANLRQTADSRCAEFIEQALRQIEQTAQAGDLIFLASLRMPRLSDQWTTFIEAQVFDSNHKADEHRNQVLAEAENIINRLEKRSLIVMLDAPKPVFKSPPFRCSDWFNASNPICQSGLSIKRSYLQEMSKPATTTLAALQKHHPKLLVWETFSALCPSDTCSAFDQQLPLFFDGDHLSAHGNRVLYPSFLALLRAAWR